MIDIQKFIDEQLAQWPLAANNFTALSGVKIRDIESLDGMRVQFNPARIRSTGAKVDAAALRERPCFLCDANRPAEQIGLDWGNYTILVNPYPIFDGHLTIACKEHTPQRIDGRIADMMRLAAELPGYTIFYNGAKCGASAPDHMHFQAVPSKYLPIWRKVKPFPGEQTVTAGMKVFVIEYDYIPDAVWKFDEYMRTLPDDEMGEPMCNILCRKGTLLVIPRRAHRPANYGYDEGQIMLSPASIDLAGVLITPFEKDYLTLDAATVRAVVGQVCFT